jgi:SAM-dependent methyltransferase
MGNLVRELEQRAWYARYYAQAGADRNDLCANRGVLFQTLASEASFIRAFWHIGVSSSDLRVLDVGCGSGATWYQLFRLGVKPHNTVGIDVQSDRLKHIGEHYPQATVLFADASQMPLADESFDLVYESTLFATLSERSLRQRVASEMIRVCKPNGYLLLVDWRVRNPFDAGSGKLNRRELQQLFGAGTTTRLLAVARGALIPPLGRLLSAYAEPFYFLIAGLLPALVGQVVYVLQKQSNVEALS